MSEAIPPAADTCPSLPSFDDPAHAFEAAVSAYASIVESVARRSNRFLERRFGDHLDDLRQAGFLALHKAVTAYLPSRGMTLRSWIWEVVRRGVWKAEHEVKRRGFGGLHNKNPSELIRVASTNESIDDTNELTILDTIPSTTTWALPCVIPDEYRDDVDRSDYRMRVARPERVRPRARKKPRPAPPLPKHVAALMAWGEEMKAKRLSRRVRV